MADAGRRGIASRPPWTRRAIAIPPPSAAIPATGWGDNTGMGAAVPELKPATDVRYLINQSMSMLQLSFPCWGLDHACAPSSFPIRGVLGPGAGQAPGLRLGPGVAGGPLLEGVGVRPAGGHPQTTQGSGFKCLDPPAVAMFASSARGEAAGALPVSVHASSPTRTQVPNWIA